MKNFKQYLESYDNRTGFKKAKREDDEYHRGPDPVQHTYTYTVSKDDGEKHSRTVTSPPTRASKRDVEPIARKRLENQGYKIHESSTCPVCQKDPCECDDSHGFVKEDNEHYDKAEEHLSKANDAEREGRMKDFHTHMADHHDAMSEWHDSKGRSASADKHAEKAEMHHEKSLTVKEETISELSSELLTKYKEKAGLAATAADAAGKYDIGHKRFKGIMKATFKQFAKDTKK